MTNQWKHGELRVGDSVVMIGEAGEQWPAVPTRGGVKDPAGNTWWMATLQ
jgi:hypothetical protein